MFKRGRLGGLEGGLYRPLCESDMRHIHQTVMRIFDEVGIQVSTRRGFDLFKGKGARVSEEKGIVFIPPAMFEDLIDLAPSEIVLYGREEKNNIYLAGRRVHFGSGGTALNILDLETGEKRPSTLEDVRNVSRLLDRLENVHFEVIPVYPNDLPTEQVDVNRFFAALQNTTKHVMGGTYTLEGTRKVIRMGEILAGSAEKLRREPFVSLITCVVSPLRIDETYGDFLMTVAEAGIPLAIPAEPIAGATAPVTIAGTVTNLCCETLAGIFLAQLVRPGTPCLFGSVGTGADMKSMGYVSGSVEEGLINAAAAQMAQFYGLPFYATAGQSDSKCLDTQAGWEGAITNLLVAMAGANFIHDAVGLLEFCMTASYEKYVVDNEILGEVMRVLKGIEVTPETLAFEVTRAVGPGGNYLSEDHTCQYMRQEHFLPSVADRNDRDTWIKTGRKDTFRRAHELATEILRTHHAEPLDSRKVEMIRETFKEVV
ncbi:MAG: trimethylamine methyltransferase family protein [Deltaproteobacteria bacterium]|nr:trimethylamine methyltransferase family protein [Deltaproteobacteria bacterium]MBW2122173.1 trimethylamine methyltransferase family protein [Deltaproteobacteria bacterium]